MEMQDRIRSGSKSVTTPKATAVHRPLTIPRAPNFATDARLGPKSLPNITGDTSSKSFVSTSTSRSTCTSTGRKSLTVPVGPKFSASKSRRTSENPPFGQYSTPSRGDLRDGLQKVATSRPKGPTIPVAPKFHSINQRPKPKSSEERELEEIERYRLNPYSSSKRIGSSENNENAPNAKRRITSSPNGHGSMSQTRTFQSASRLSKPSDRLKSSVIPDHSRSIPFKARPMPRFSEQKRGMSGVPRVVSRSVTTPVPFHLTEQRSKNAELTVSTKFSTDPDDLAVSMSSLTIAKEIPTTSDFQDLSPITHDSPASTFNTGVSTISEFTERKVEVGDNLEEEPKQ